MTETAPARLTRRIYPLDPRELTEEELAVVFAMTSRRPEPFDETQRLVTTEKAANFHERWVLGYGHASVAEHAVLHLAVENISRLACDALEDNRLASFTEKSSRYQVLDQGAYHVPGELDRYPEAGQAYREASDRLFAIYERLVKVMQAYLAAVEPRLSDERGASHRIRLRRIATDTCRFVLPASTLTNVGVTMNARSVEHAVRKLLSSELQEEREIGKGLKEQARVVTPTLIRYAERNDYLELSRDRLRDAAPEPTADPVAAGPSTGVSARLVDWDPLAQARLVAALLYRNAGLPYEEVWRRAQGLSEAEQEAVLAAALDGLGDHDAPVRELEQVAYTFELLMDYGAYREFKRHRMQSYLPQPLTVAEGYVTPPLIAQAGLASEFAEAMDVSASAHRRLAATAPPRLAEYAVTHAHLRRVMTRVNLRECYTLFQLRIQPEAHFTIRDAMGQALDCLREVHPLLVQYVRLRGQ